MISGLSLAACDLVDDADVEVEMRAKPDRSPEYGPGYSLHLASVVRFDELQPEANADNGRMLFGANDDLDEEDKTNALFQGFSMAAEDYIVSNERTCFTCHRGTPEGFGLPKPPLSGDFEGSISLSDALFTGIEADAAGDPDAFKNLNELGLIKYQVNRFNPLLGPDAPFRIVHGWRKSPKLHNIGLQIGFLTDCRGRALQDAARGAVLAHTQNGNKRFDDLFPPENANDMEAFLVSLITDERLEDLRDSNAPLHKRLIRNPYLTVKLSTRAQRAGRRVFDEYCFACHNMPNVFSNIDNVDPLAGGARTPGAISWAAPIGRAFNIGVSERNAHGLRFTAYVEGGNYEDIVLPLANEDGSINEHTVKFDIGLAMTTRRTVDIGRFKVPQLRNLEQNAPYFHDNSAATIEEVVDYFNSDDYNDSADGQRFPIHLDDQQRADLIEFLKIL